MPDIFYLFLDESETHDETPARKWINSVFSIAGIVVKSTDHSTIIEPELNTLKKSIWHDLTDPEKKILHEKDIRFALKPQNTHK